MNSKVHNVVDNITFYEPAPYTLDGLMAVISVTSFFSMLAIFVMFISM